MLISLPGTTTILTTCLPAIAACTLGSASAACCMSSLPADEAALDDLTAEIIDRFGSLPPSAQHLLRIARLKLLARALGIRRLDLGPQGGYVLFEETNNVDAGAVVRMIQKSPGQYRLESALKLRMSHAFGTEEARFKFAADLLKRLGQSEGR